MSTAPSLLPDDEANQRLGANTHPGDWRPPTPAGRYNLVVLGAGTAGLVSAAGAAGLGGKVALVERHLMGGDCLVYGCVPSKGLIRASRAAYDARTSAEFGVTVTGTVQADFAVAAERMRRLRADISVNDSAQRFASLGVDVFLGDARFVGPDEVEVAGQRLRFARAILATGARAAVPPIPGLLEAGYLTNETVFSLTKAPRRLIVLGGGPIGCELAQMFRRFGTEVWMVSQDSHLLPREDRDAAALLQQQLKREGIHILLSAKALDVKRSPQGKTMTVESEGRREPLEADELLIATGRVPNLEGLQLEAAQVKWTEHGVTVDDHLRTSNPRIYAAGDVASRFKFTHTADALARIALQNALFFGRKKASALVVPWVTFTDPEIAHVGMYEEDARNHGFDVLTHTYHLKELDRAILDGETEGFARVHLERKSGRILGATLVARHAGEMMGEMGLAVTSKMKMGAVGGTIHAYPTQIEAWKRLADLHNRTRLTPGVLKFFQRLLAWRR